VKLSVLKATAQNKENKRELQKYKKSAESFSSSIEMEYCSRNV
jgi:hypothetical protein